MALMRYLIFSFSLFTCFLFSHAVAGVTPDAVMRAARAGAPQFALSAVEDAQAAASQDRAQWLAWEAARWDLLYQLGRWQDLLELTLSPPADISADMQRHALWRSAQALAALHRDAEARGLLARLIWQGGLAARQMREARLLLIETLFSMGRGDDAYLAVLRFQQDFSPLEKNEIERLATGLSSHGKIAEALAWLPQVKDPAVALLLRLHGGMAQIHDAVGVARSELRKGGGAGYWAVLNQVAIRLPDPLLRVEALENLLSAQGQNQAEALHVAIDDLWKSYEALALATGNQHQLLQGDEGAWLDLSVRLEQQNPQGARAIMAHLARHATNQRIRQDAEKKLFNHLIRAGLIRAAFRLFAEKTDLTLISLHDAGWVENPGIRRSVLLELARHEMQLGDHERAAEYLLQLLDGRP